MPAASLENPTLTQKEDAEKFAMEGPYLVQQQQQQQQFNPHFFYYHPDPNPETRHHGQFTPHPNGMQFQAPHMPQMHQMQQMPIEQPMPIYAAHAYQQPAAQSPQQFAVAGYSPKPLMTPMQSPQQAGQKLHIMVQHDSPYAFSLDGDYAPSTPPLSASGSAVSSPPSTCEVLPTPVNSSFVGQTLDGIKAGADESVLSEILAGEDWTNATPPMTPSKFATFPLPLPFFP
jgi:hypothetical protein